MFRVVEEFEALYRESTQGLHTFEIKGRICVVPDIALAACDPPDEPMRPGKLYRIYLNSQWAEPEGLVSPTAPVY